ncbi:hypothetical protein C8Q69DRAFT_158938 [Paecilomyces variotii]|uniref:DUF726 domain protein n=1 Tax=Byssochlamys spectabilis TaxID=264951 RepID=A0A443I1Z6_BYSSP|nr:hypothetical protein C8Q69DRAFT_158938 [Paecilomyces variotii]KAJ9362315.1 hypothetical protein DTO280E4_3565 [Paecilomyces variotii]KAJ9392603.1 hypothetical protein DTO063F5_403 [Paecilomyces variotii]RWQ98071.1 hypothetical protein C8Q69DRAFT_158938 [Paecilomyces variotii]
MAARLRQYVGGSFSAQDNAPDERSGGEDLSTILDRHQRGELTVLVAQIMLSMRKAIVDNFHAAAPFKHASESEKVLKDRANSQEEPAPDPEQQASPGPKQSIRRKPVAQSAQSAPSAPSAITAEDIKAEAETLRHFDDWRDSVLLRIGEVVNKDNETDGRERKASDARPVSQQSSISTKETRSARLRELFPPTETELAELPEPARLLILHSLLLLLLSLKHYSAYSRVLLLNVASSLGLSLQVLNEDEIKVSRGLLTAAKEMEATEEAKQRAEKSSNARKWKVGIASVAGAALIGLTGGLAAPLVAAGIGTVMGGLGLGATAAAGYLGALAGSSVIVGGLFGAYGGRMTGKMMDNYAREVEDFAFIPTRGTRKRFLRESEAAKEDRRLRVTIGVSGWAHEEDDIVIPWRVIGKDSETFALRWELKSLLKLGNAISAFVTSAAWSFAGKEILSRTVFAGIMSAVMLPVGLLKIASVVDNPFSVAKSRADKAGEVLADALINKAQGERPVTLIGYSLGSRVIYSCLQSLAKRHAYGLVESAILMGSPVPSDTRQWRRMRTAVSGRLVNVFSEKDAVLGFLYRGASIQLGVAGLQRVQGLPGVENVNVSDIVSGHLRYQYLIGKILSTIGFDEIDAAEVEKEEIALKARDAEEERARAHNEQRAKAEGDEKQTAITAEETARLESQVEERTEQHYMHHKMHRIELYDNEEGDDVGKGGHTALPFPPSGH